MIPIIIHDHTGFRDTTYTTTSFIFPGGEIQAKVDGLPEDFDDVSVEARIQSSDDLVHLLLLLDMLEERHGFGYRKFLTIPYFPYARQDRMMNEGEAFSLRSVARLINDHPWPSDIVVYDPHSDVTPALLSKCQVVDQTTLIQAHPNLQDLLGDPSTLIVAPDAGAAKKAWKTAASYNLDMVTASKIRDVKTGEITGTIVHEPEKVAGRDCLIVDDICDGGRTFIELAKVLRLAGAAKVHLYVTHGIFSKGLVPLLHHIDEVYTTDSFLRSEGSISLDVAETTGWHLSPCFSATQDVHRPRLRLDDVHRRTHVAPIDVHHHLHLANENFS